MDIVGSYIRQHDTEDQELGRGADVGSRMLGIMSLEEGEHERGK